MKKLLQIPALVGLLLLLVVPRSALSQTTVGLNVLPDAPAAGFTTVEIEVMTDTSPNTFGSATVDIRYDTGVYNFAAASGGVLSTHNNTFESACVAYFLLFAPECGDFPPYAFQAVEELSDGTSPYVRFSVTGANVGQYVSNTINSDSLVIDGYEVPSTAVVFRQLVFQNVVTEASLGKSQVVGFEIEPTTLSVGFFDSPDNDNETGLIVDDCKPTSGNGCSIDAPLPVELGDFSAVVDNGDVVLSWVTASETDNAGFSVEHAVGEGGTFEEIAFVEGAGTSLEARTYSYTVRGLDIGTHRFRLKQLDYDGSFEFSSTVETTIELAGTHRLGAAYPNPFNPTTTFELVVGREQTVRIDIINALGQRVQRMFEGTMEANKPTNFTFQAGNLPTGLYFYRAVGETFAQTRQVLLVK